MILDKVFIADQDLGVIKALVIAEYVDLDSGYLKTRVSYQLKNKTKTTTVDECNVFNSEVKAKAQLVKIREANALLDVEIKDFNAKTDKIRDKVIGKPFMTKTQLKLVKPTETVGGK